MNEKNKELVRQGESEEEKKWNKEEVDRERRKGVKITLIL